MHALSALADFIRADWRRNRRQRKSRFILLAFRLLHPLAVAGPVVRLVSWPLFLLYQIVVEWVLCVELPLKAEVGKGLRIGHGYALVVNDRVRIGENCTLRHCTTLGVTDSPAGEPGPAPSLGDNVDVGANVVIIGGVHIGSGARIGAGSVVTRDVEPGATVVGNPARPITPRTPDTSECQVFMPPLHEAL